MANPAVTVTAAVQPVGVVRVTVATTEKFPNNTKCTITAHPMNGAQTYRIADAEPFRSSLIVNDSIAPLNVQVYYTASITAPWRNLQPEPEPKSATYWSNFARGNALATAMRSTSTDTPWGGGVSYGFYRLEVKQTDVGQTIPYSVVVPGGAVTSLRVDANGTYTGSIYARVSEVPAGVQLQANMQWYTSAGGGISATAGSIIDASIGWRRLSVSGVAPANAAYATIYLNWRGNPPVGNFLFSSGAMITNTSWLTPYTAGSAADVFDYTSNTITITATKPILAVPLTSTTQESMALTVYDWPDLDYESRLQVFRPADRPEPVIIRAGNEQMATSQITVVTTTAAELAAFRRIARYGLPMSLRATCAAVESAWFVISKRTERRRTRRGTDWTRLHVCDIIHTVAPDLS